MRFPDGLNDTGVAINLVSLTTPGGVFVDAREMYLSYYGAVVVESIILWNTTSLSLGEVKLLEPTIARMAVVRWNQDWLAKENWDNYDPYEDIDVVECEIALAAERYTNVSFSDGKLHVENQDLIPLQPGHLVYERTEKYVYGLDFIQDGLPQLGARVPDVIAIQKFLTSRRFACDVNDGVENGSNKNQLHGIGMAFA